MPSHIYILFRTLKSLKHYCNVTKKSSVSLLSGFWLARILWTTLTATTKLLAWCWLLLEVSFFLLGTGFPAIFPPFSQICWSNLSPPQVWTTRSWSVWPRLTLAAFLLSMREMLSLSCLPVDLQAVRCVIWEQIEFFIVLIWMNATIVYQNCFPLPLIRSVCVMIVFLLRTLRSLLKELAWPAQTSSHSWWQTPSLAASIWPMAVERWVRSFKLPQRSGNKKFPL